jgi:hypothetical protein
VSSDEERVDVLQIENLEVIWDCGVHVVSQGTPMLTPMFEAVLREDG